MSNLIDITPSSHQLLGPPEIYAPKMGVTENHSATFLSTLNPCLDFFFHVVPNTPVKSVVERLELAWKYNPLTTLKLICNLRGVRGTGKSDKEGFYAAALWLHENHPKTLACNIWWFANVGYIKDLPEVLYRVLEGLDVRKRAKEEKSEMERIMGCTWKSGKRKRIHGSRGKDDIVGKRPRFHVSGNDDIFTIHGRRPQIHGLRGNDDIGSIYGKRQGIHNCRDNSEKKKKAKGGDPKVEKKEKITAMVKKALDRYTNDGRYDRRKLHNSVKGRSWVLEI
ncbi:hypothetical protein GIB67_041851 [Kingdonia uniflora]|uniref:DUF2828 domain-containing protein n=1 Tax=Kingdonia uniflora TaxID=39325 RepID=A0A7J7L601_9MAGN|nr:hypothetical protein GIB67_041851 [Kingdonia uniflora]